MLEVVPAKQSCIKDPAAERILFILRRSFNIFCHIIEALLFKLAHTNR